MTLGLDPNILRFLEYHVLTMTSVLFSRPQTDPLPDLWMYSLVPSVVQELRGIEVIVIK